MQSIIRTYGLIDKNTGEIFNAEIKICKPIGEYWMKIYQVAMDSLLQKKMKGSSLTVMNLLIAKAKYQNHIPSQTKLSNLTGMSRPLVSRAFLELAKLDFLYKKDGIYYINPIYAWKGTDKDREQAIKEMSEIRKAI